jgi:hypothetical protein
MNRHAGVPARPDFVFKNRAPKVSVHHRVPFPGEYPNLVGRTVAMPEWQMKHVNLCLANCGLQPSIIEIHGPGGKSHKHARGWMNFANFDVY